MTFNGTPATVTSWSDTAIGVVIPPGATNGPVVVTVNGVASNGVTFTVVQATGTAIRYIYDELSRLVGVVDQAGNAATYRYDAVGNLTGITRPTASASQVSIIDFTPNEGPVGATVTIYGTGFDAAPAQNTVQLTA